MEKAWKNWTKALTVLWNNQYPGNTIPLDNYYLAVLFKQMPDGIAHRNNHNKCNHIENKDTCFWGNHALYYTNKVVCCMYKNRIHKTIRFAVYYGSNNPHKWSINGLNHIHMTGNDTLIYWNCERWLWTDIWTIFQSG